MLTLQEAEKLVKDAHASLTAAGEDGVWVKAWVRVPDTE